jgi:membrane associated rhomboid family serine protease/Flp pilus assembly protein TadD
MNNEWQEPEFGAQHPQDAPSAGAASPEPQRTLPEPGYFRRAKRPVPVATLTIIALCVLVFILQTLAGGSRNPNILVDFGASYGPYFKQGEYWRAVMPMFLHIGWWHLAVNMYVLYLLGPILEQMYGYGRYAFIYVGAGIGGSLLSMFHGHTVAAGASGAIMGVGGAVLVAGYLHRDSLPYALARVFRRGTLSIILLIFVVIQLVSGFMVPNIDNWGHLGGLITGAVLAFLIPPPRLAEADGTSGMEVWAHAPKNARPSQAAVWVPVVVVAVAMAATASHYRVAHSVSQLLDEGRRLQAANQPNQAIDRYKRAEQLDGRDERPHEGLAGAYLQQRRFSDAIAEYNQALRLNPDSVPAQLGLAAAYQANGDLAKAQKIFENILGKNPRDAGAQEALGDLLAGQKLYQQATEHYQQALRLSPRMAVTHNNLAWLYATADDPKFRNSVAALNHARQAVELTGWREPEFIDTLAEALYANHNYAEAVKVQERALKLAPDNREFQDHMARYRKAAGV